MIILFKISALVLPLKFIYSTLIQNHE